jgi:putative tricarboxylic transport membrane protein
MFEVFVQGFLNYLDLFRFSFLILGVLIGIFIGIVPALGGIVAMSLLLPLVFGMDKIASLSMLIAIHAISGTGDNITSIMMGVPGSGPATVLLLDGFPMTRRGEPGRALGVMMCADTMGALLGVGMAFLMIPVVRPLVLSFGNSELFFLILMGLSFLAILTRESPVKGLMAGFTGIILSLIGYQHSTGVDRFAFGNELLLNGLRIVPVVLGLFAGTAMLEMAVFKETIVPSGVVKVGKELRQQFFVGVKEVFQHKWLWFRSCVLGYVMGLIPGIGPEVAVWVSYGQAKQTSRHPELFGTGCVEGIIAPESTNNAKEGASLLTALCLGLPSGVSMAILLGALLLQGVIPGPSILTTDLELTFTLIWGLALANVIGVVLCYYIVGYLNLTKLITLPPHILVPTILSIVYLGSYTSDNQVAAIGITILFSVIGLVMKRGGYSRAALVLGFILGRFFEDYFFLALQTLGPFFFLRPTSIGIIVIIISLYIYRPVLSFMKRHGGMPPPVETDIAKEEI